MDLLNAYDSDESQKSIGPATKAGTPINTTLAPSGKKVKLDLAPDVNIQDLTSFNYLPDIKTKEIMHNLPYHDLAKPDVGPSNPFATAKLNRNNLTGFVEDYAMSDFAFDSMQRTFNNFGYAAHPEAMSGDQYVGDLTKMQERNGATIYDHVKKDKSRKRKPKGDPEKVGGYLGPWAGYVGEEEIGLVGPTDEEKAAAEAATKAAQEAMAEGGKLQTVEAEPGKEKTTFHGKAEFDYMGRTYMHVPTDIGINLHAEPGNQECFLPKTLIHTWTGHTKGINSIKFFPKSAHLLLSASMDTKVKLWDVYHDRRCLRTYMGHSKAVKAIDFTNDGTKFMSASYDKWMKLWDTETGSFAELGRFNVHQGKCIHSFTTRRIPYCIKFNPAGDNNQFLAGCQDKKIYQFDTRSGDIVQEYDQHLGAVNTITFIDDNRRFVSTSDDKTIRVWEYGIPVVIKYIAEPTMHSMPAVALHPSKKWMATQSLDNQIMIYSAKDRFRLQSKKVFRGHLVAGYACQPGFSADGRFVMSGDSEGRVWFWDWKTCKVFKKLKCHNNVVIACEWHPHETSKVATASWDGTIK
ncbi:pre-mRNA-processing factor 17 [Dinochytrium kinnereticum]|nr:pre-mRNA-processing factor 17 [Dinochytrium kinnereticum]